jgi:hypothetical protein
MFFTNTSISLRRSLLALALSTCASLASAATYHISLDTSSFADSGWIDVMFNAGNTDSAAAQVYLSDFVGFGDSATASTIGSVGGSLASGYTIANNDPGGLNDLFHEVNFGGVISFNVSFSGAADPAQTASGSVFSVALFNYDQNAVLGTTDPFGSLVQLNWSPAVSGSAGSVVATPLVNDIATMATAVPEPSTWLMLGAGLALVGLARRRRMAA